MSTFKKNYRKRFLKMRKDGSRNLQGPSMNKSLARLVRDAPNWKCTCCGKPCDPVSPDWRWTGYRWEHHHGYPAGHIPAEKKLSPGMNLLNAVAAAFLIVLVILCLAAVVFFVLAYNDIGPVRFVGGYPGFP